MVLTAGALVSPPVVPALSGPASVTETVKLRSPAVGVSKPSACVYCIPRSSA